MTNDERKPNRPTDERLWIAATEGGDQSAFAVLYARHRPTALRIARRICGDDAEDALQAAFLSIWTSRDGYERRRGSISSWMLTVVRNRSIDMVRTPRRHREIATEPTEMDLVEPVTTEELAATQDTTERMRAAVELLPQRQRSVVALGYFGELSQTEIANRLGVPLGTVKGRTRAGLKNLQPAALAAAA